MLIPGLALTPGLVEHLQRCGDESLVVEPTRQWCDTHGGLCTSLVVGPHEDCRIRPAGVQVVHADGSELSEHERTRVEGVLAAHRAQAF